LYDGNAAFNVWINEWVNEQEEDDDDVTVFADATTDVITTDVITTDVITTDVITDFITVAVAVHD
jgi:hypothetical protein